MTDQKITIKYTLVLVLVVFITWIIHEFAHWATSERSTAKAVPSQ